MSGNRDNHQIIHVGIAFDRRYLRPFFALVGSLIKNHSRNEIEIHAITDGLSKKDIGRITAMIDASNNRISFYEVDRAFAESFVLSSEWTSVVYYRLFFSRLVPAHVNRLLYLDCDTLVVNPLRTLYNFPLDNFPVAAVYDNYVRTQPRIGITEDGEYFNSGVLLIDMQKWRQQDISEKAFKYLREHPERIMYVDQCALNAVLRNNWKKLNFKFNVMYSTLPESMSKDQIKEILEEGVVVHFTLQRPWQMLCKNRLRFLYFQYLNHAGLAPSVWNSYTDFHIKKIPAWFMIRVHELYFDSPYIQKLWRSVQWK